MHARDYIILFPEKERRRGRCKRKKKISSLVPYTIFKLCKQSPTMNLPLCLLFCPFFFFLFSFIGKKEFAVLFRKSTSLLVFHEREKGKGREREREVKLRAGKQEYEYLAGYRVEEKL